MGDIYKIRKLGGDPIGIFLPSGCSWSQLVDMASFRLSIAGRIVSMSLTRNFSEEVNDTPITDSETLSKYLELYNDAENHVFTVYTEGDSVLATNNNNKSISSGSTQTIKAFELGVATNEKLPSKIGHTPADFVISADIDTRRSSSMEVTDSPSVSSASAATHSDIVIPVRYKDAVHDISLPPLASWDDITSLLAAKFSLSNPKCVRGITLIDIDGDSMSPEFDNSKKFWKFLNNYHMSMDPASVFLMDVMMNYADDTGISECSSVTSNTHYDSVEYRDAGADHTISMRRAAATSDASPRVAKSLPDSALPLNLHVSQRPVVASHALDATLWDVCESGDSATARYLLSREESDPAEFNENGSQAIHVAAHHGHVEVIEVLLEFGVDVNSPNENGATPLHFACYESNQAVEYLLSHGADPAFADSTGVTPAHLMCQMGLTQPLQGILASHVDVNVADDQDNTLLHTAATSGKDHIIKILLEHGANPNVLNDLRATPLHISCASGSFASASLLVAHGACVNAIDKLGTSPLQFACRNGDVVLAQWLVSHGALVNHANLRGNTCLHYACEHGNINLVKWLLECHADIYLENAKGKTPVDQAKKHPHVHEIMLRKLRSEEQRNMDDVVRFHEACASGDTKMAYQCIHRGIDCDARNRNSFTALHFACLTGQSQIVEMLFDNGADINIQEYRGGMTPLLCACHAGFASLAMRLVEIGADISMTSYDGRTPLHYAAINGSVELIDFLLSLRFDINHPSLEDITPVLDACSCGNVAVVQHLVVRGAVMNVVTKTGRNALHMACASNSIEMVQWIVAEQRHLMNSNDYSGMTAFLIACTNGSLEIARFLAEQGAVTTSRAKACESNNSALLFACRDGHLEVAQWLVEELGLDINETNYEGQSSVDLSRDSGVEDLIEWIENGGATLTLPEDTVDNVEVRDALGVTVLHTAAAGGDIELIEALLKRGADVNSVTLGGSSVLHFACENGQFAVVKLLIETYGADINVRDKSGHTPLDCALKRNYSMIIDFLQGKLGTKKSPLKNLLFACVPAKPAMYAPKSFAPPAWETGRQGFTPPQTLDFISEELKEACVNGSLSEVQQLFEGGENHDFIDKSTGSTPLHLSCFSGNMELVSYIVECGASLNVQNVGGMTPLHIACDRQYNEIAIFLIKKGADLSLRNKAGFSALHIICSRGNVDLIQDIISMPRSVLPELDLEVKTENGLSLMHVAVKSGHLNIVRALIFQQSLVNKRDESNKTPLHYACMDGQVEIAEVLLTHGSFINARENDGMTPFLYACQNGNLTLAKLLVDKGANIHVESDTEGNGLHIACAAGDMSFVKWLVRLGLNAEEAGVLGTSPIQLAMSYGRTKIVDWILAWTLGQGTGIGVNAIRSELSSS